MSDVRRVAVVGPTASGKSALAHAIASSSEGRVEVLSVDAMSVYRGMDLATAKPSLAERRQVRYHLLDLVDPSEEFTVVQFQVAAQHALREIKERSNGALYVGGTGLYGRAVLDDLEIPGQYPEVRQTLDARVREDPDGLYHELLKLDPLGASRIEPSNTRRVLRALEVTLGAGRPFSSFGEGLLSYGPVHVLQVGLDVDLDVLDERISARFRRWLDEGLVEEVRRLVASPLGLSRTARQAVGYRQLLRHVEEGAPLARCVDEALAKSRQLARRQRSWFRRDPRVEWFADLEAAASRVRTALFDAPAGVRD